MTGGPVRDRPRFVFEDLEEPPPPRWGRRLGLAGGVTVALAALVVAGTSLTGGSGEPARAPKASAAAAPAEPVTGVVALDGSGSVEVAQPSGETLRTLLRLPARRASADLHAAVSHDGHTLVLSDLTVVDLTGSSRPHRLTSLPYLYDMPPEPWAQNDTFFVTGSPEVGDDRSGNEQISLARPEGSDERVLASAALPAGDPLEQAVFGVEDGTRTVRLEGTDRTVSRALVHDGSYRPGGVTLPYATLVSAGRLAHWVGAPRSSVVLDQPSVSPDGGYLAVPVTGVAGATPSTGWVVTDGNAKRKATVDAERGRRPLWSSWSSQDVLAYADTDGHGHDRLFLWDPLRDGSPHRVRLGTPSAASMLEHRCLWSPDAKQLLCGTGERWAVVDATSGRSHVVAPVPGRPLAWVDGTRG